MTLKYILLCHQSNRTVTNIYKLVQENKYQCKLIYCTHNSEICLNWTLNKPESCIYRTLNKVSMKEIIIICTCLNRTMNKQDSCINLTLNVSPTVGNLQPVYT